MVHFICILAQWEKNGDVSKSHFDQFSPDLAFLLSFMCMASKVPVTSSYLLLTHVYQLMEYSLRMG